MGIMEWVIVTIIAFAVAGTIAWAVWIRPAKQVFRDESDWSLAVLRESVDELRATTRLMQQERTTEVEQLVRHLQELEGKI